jgi:hypothetical protein
MVWPSILLLHIIDISRILDHTQVKGIEILSKYWMIKDQSNQLGEARRLTKVYAAERQLTINRALSELIMAGYKAVKSRTNAKDL